MRRAASHRCREDHWIRPLLTDRSWISSGREGSLLFHRLRPSASGLNTARPLKCPRRSKTPRLTCQTRVTTALRQSQPWRRDCLPLSAHLYMSWITAGFITTTTRQPDSCRSKESLMDVKTWWLPASLTSGSQPSASTSYRNDCPRSKLDGRPVNN